MFLAPLPRKVWPNRVWTEARFSKNKKDYGAFSCKSVMAKATALPVRHWASWGEAKMTRTYFCPFHWLAVKIASVVSKLLSEYSLRGLKLINQISRWSNSDLFRVAFWFLLWHLSITAKPPSSEYGKKKTCGRIGCALLCENSMLNHNIEVHQNKKKSPHTFVSERQRVISQILKVHVEKPSVLSRLFNICCFWFLRSISFGSSQWSFETKVAFSCCLLRNSIH